MKHWNACRAAFALAMLVMFGPDAMAAGVSILGKWQIVEAVPAPWSRPEEQAALAAAGKRLLNTEVTVRAGLGQIEVQAVRLQEQGASTRPTRSRSTRCSRAICRSPTRAAAAARLGFPKGDIPGVDVRCLKALYTFHFRDPNTALINLDRVIYTLKRQ